MVINPRVLILGNTNNEPFRLGAELAYLGCRVTVVLASRGRLHDPRELKGFPYFSRCHLKVLRRLKLFPQYSWMIPRTPILSSVAHLAEDHDFVITNGVAHSLAPDLRRPWASMITGADVYDYAASDWPSRSPSRWMAAESAIGRRDRQLVLTHFQERQARGLRHASFLIGAPQGASENLDLVLTDLGAIRSRRFNFVSGPSLVTLNGSQVSGQRDHGSRYVLLAPRLSSRSIDPSLADMDDKGSHVALAGWSIAVERGYAGKLVAFKKGAHTPNLIQQAVSGPAAAAIVWLPAQSYAGYLQLVANADLVIESLGASPVGRGAIEAIANGVPCISSSTQVQVASRLGVDSQLHSTCLTPSEVGAAIASISDRSIAGTTPANEPEGWSSPSLHAQEILNAIRMTLV